MKPKTDGQALAQMKDHQDFWFQEFLNEYGTVPSIDNNRERRGKTNGKRPKSGREFWRWLSVKLYNVMLASDTAIDGYRESNQSLMKRCNQYQAEMVDARTKADQEKQHSWQMIDKYNDLKQKHIDLKKDRENLNEDCKHLLDRERQLKAELKLCADALTKCKQTCERQHETITRLSTEAVKRETELTKLEDHRDRLLDQLFDEDVEPCPAP